MNLNKLEQTKKMYNENCNKINDMEDRIDLININNNDNQIIMASLFSILSFVFSILGTSAVANIKIIPTEILSYLPIIISGTLGFGIKELVFKKYKFREKLKKISNSKTEQEKVQEETICELEKEKLIYQNKVLKNICKNLSSNESTTENNFEKTIDDENIELVLKNKIKELDIKTTQKFLCNRFLGIRSREGKILNIIKISALGAFIPMALCFFSQFALNNILNVPIETNYFTFLPLMLTGGIVSGCYVLKRNKVQSIVFNNLNQSLGENSVSDVFDYNEINDMNKQIKNIMDDLVNIKSLTKENDSELKKDNLLIQFNQNKEVNYINYEENNELENKQKRLTLTNTKKK